MIDALITTLRRPLAALAAVAVTLAAAQIGLADKIYMKDGSVYEGEIIKEIGDVIFFEIRVGDARTELTLLRSNIERIEETEKSVEALRKEELREEAKQVSDDAVRVAFLSMGDETTGRGTVGTYLTADSIRNAVKELEKLPEDMRPSVLVFDVDSPGGFTFEVTHLSDLIHEELKPEYRVVAWIESAISAAAMTSWNIEEIVMKKQGHIGAATQFSGGGQSSQGASLEDILIKAENWSKRGKRSAHVIKAMQMPYVLSCDVDRSANTVTWYNHLEGEEIVNPEGRVLTLNAPECEDYMISTGTCDTKDELMEHLGYREWVEVGHEAEEVLQDHFAAVKEGEARLREHYNKYLRTLDVAAGLPEDIRPRFLGQARDHLEKIKSFIRKAPPLRRFNQHGLWFREEWFDQQYKIIRDLGRRSS